MPLARHAILGAIAALLVVGALTTLVTLDNPRPAQGIIPIETLPPFGVALLVDTATYPGVYLDGYCSLDEAIAAANSNSQADPSSGFCNANLSSPGATDGIEFAIGTGTPTINITSPPPTITDKLGISGAGTADRVELHGPGSGTGITISTAGAAGSAIRSLVLNNFGTALSLSSTNNITIAGNYFGTNAAGTGVIQNGMDISLSTASATIGGLSGLTTGGPCTGDCNLISGGSLGGTPRGIDMRNSSSATIRGNFIGTDFSGMFPLPNGTGIYLDKSSATIGGTAAGAGNVISGNTTGIRVQTNVDMAQGSLIQGNFIGTNVLGTASIPNSGDGITVVLGNRDYPVTIGGSAAGAGNVISGNAGAGIQLFTADYVTIHGNLIGTQPDETTASPNGDAGIRLSSSTHFNVIGGIAAEEGNVIAFNAAGGVAIGVFDYYNQIRGNSIHDNTGKGISLADNQDDHAFTPAITGVNPVTGTACANCTIDVYSDSADEGRQYEGTITADGAGNWTYNAPVSGPNVTATATGADLSTSEFSTPFALPATPTPTPSPSPTPSTTPTPTITPTPTLTTTPTPTPTVTPAHTPTHTATPTATPTTTPTPTPTTTPSELTQGDVDCNGNVTSVDALKELRFVAQLSVSQTEPCPDIGDNVASLWGDVDCNTQVNSVDALKILRFVAGLSVSQTEPCPDIGTPES